MKAELKNMSIREILAFQSELEKERCSRFDNLINTITAISKLEQKKQKIYNYYNKRINQLRNNNEEIKQLQEMGFSVDLSGGIYGGISIINFSNKDKPNQYYGCDIDFMSRNIKFGENEYLKTSDLEKIKEILKLN
jgi:hypothetical protein